MVLGQNMVVLAGTWWYWVIKSWYCLALGGREGQYRALCLYILKKWTFGQVLPIPQTQQNMGLLSLPKI